MEWKHTLFAQYFVELGNQTQAAIKAGYSKESASSTASRLMKREDIQEYINARLFAHSLQMAEKIRKVDEMVFNATQVNAAELFNPDNALKPIANLDEITQRNIKSVKTRELFTSEGELMGYTREVTLNDPLKAAEIFYKRNNLFNENPIQQNFVGEISLNLIAPTGKLAEVAQTERAEFERLLEAQKDVSC